jgi:type I restriction enzyme M protein
LTAEEAKTLILQKLYNWAKEHLTRYLNQAKRTFIAQVEKLWDKYAVSSRVLEEQREETLTTLNQYLDRLGYLGK